MNDMNKQMHYVLYHVDDSDVSVNAVIQNDSIWITQKAMAELFGCTSDNISSHLKNIYSEGELIKEATTEKISVVQKEGSRNVKRNIDFYNLDAIISVGYRVNSRQATKFRIWATGVLKEYMIKGFVLDDERLKQKEESGSRSQIFLRNAVSIMTKIQMLQNVFIPQYRTNFTMR